MSRVAYYPGCAMKRSARACERSALAAAGALGFELEELERWNCCGTVFSLAADDLIRHVAPLRNLVRVQQAGHDTVATLCGMCHNTLARVDALVRAQPETLARLNRFLEPDPPYAGGVRVAHLLTLLLELPPDRLAARVVRPLRGLRVGPYYGCGLLRPAEAAITDAEAPAAIERLLTAIGADPVRHPLRGECCGSYLTAQHPGAVAARVDSIHQAARARGAELLVTMCPLCDYNLDARASDGLPVLYVTQLLALALGLDPQLEALSERATGAGSLLAERVG